MKRLTVWLARAGCIVIAGVTFLTSFDAISDVAIATGAVSPRLAWAVPLAVDGMILVGSAVAWTEAIDGRWHPFPLAAVGGAAVLSVWANVAHAPDANLLGKSLAAVPPIALIISVELAAWQIRQAIKRTAREEQETEARAAGRAVKDAAARAAAPLANGKLRGGDSAEITSGVVTTAGFNVELWDRIVAYVNQAEQRPTPSVLAEALGTTPEIVRQAIEAQRDQWDWLARSDQDDAAGQVAAGQVEGEVDGGQPARATPT